jgi:hypothetical protein
MIFINNKYTNIYYRIIDRAKVRALTEYSEEHHIIPKSLGGNNDKTNLVKLTAREHFICHLLLVKMTTGDDKRKMSYALWLMCNLKNHLQPQRHVPNSNTYDVVRKNHSSVVSASQRGIKKTYSSFGGKKHTDKTKLLQSEIKTGSKNPNFGVTQLPEWNESKSKAQKGIKKPAITCEVCGVVVGGHGNYKRWHGTQCKLNNIL